MPAQAVALIGAGNLRSAHHVICALSRYNLPQGCEIRLYEASPEPLDLYDRFARACVDRTGGEHLIRSTNELKEALEGVSAIVICPDEDCCRRMVQPAEGYESLAFGHEEEPQNVNELRRGDINIPTPTEQLSEQHMAILQRPRNDSMPTDEAFQQALAAIRKEIQGRPHILDLMLENSYTGEGEVVNQRWPEEIDENVKSVRPHEVLRCSNADPLLDVWLRESETSIVAEWLAQLP